MVDVWFHGQACVRVKGRTATVVFDPFDPSFTGLAPLKIAGDIVCVSHQHQDHNNASAVVPTEEGKTPFVISGPGEYEISGVNIVGIPSFHDDKEGAERGRNTIYHVTVDDVNFVHLGDLGQKKLTQEQVSELSTCDVLFIPVGSVYTISGKEAPDIIAQIEPSIIIPIHFKLPGLKFGLDDVSVFLATLGKEKLAPQQKFSISRERLPEEPEVVLLEKQ
ncbi:MBL fold metallo-hydrolase [Candidatus Curtissbacteria bacterium]|nr:MBL fold metallo-hydrolase [Candidatus Curtissbacteria bacterium]